MERELNAAQSAAAAEQRRLANLPIEQLDLAVIDRMSGDTYKSRLSNKEFVDKVNELESKRPPRPRSL
jgi:hypothetical protein